MTVVAWDDNGNSTYQHYKIIYKVRDEGEKIGTATVRLDLSVLGLGVVDTVMDCDIFQDQPASYVIKAALEYLGYRVSFSGTLDEGFYLTRISRASAFEGVAIPEELQKLLELDRRALAQFGTGPLGQFKQNWSVKRLDTRFAEEDGQTG